MKVLLFGGEGLVGKALQKILSENNISFRSVSRKSGVDISNYDDFKKIPYNNFNVVINLATTLPGGDYLDSEYLNRIYKVNILGSQNICRWMLSQPSVTKVVNASTLVVNKKPWKIGLKENDCSIPTGNHVLYSCSKLFQEAIFSTFCDKNSIPLVNLRFSAVYGEEMTRQGILIDFLNKAKANNDLHIKNGKKVSADFINVIDVAAVIYEAIKKPVTGVINVASGTETFVEDLAKMAVDATNSTSLIYNIEDESFSEDRAVIDISELKKIVDTSKFTTLNEGIKSLIK